MILRMLVVAIAMGVTIQNGLATSINGFTTQQNASLGDCIINGGADLKSTKADSLTIHGNLSFADLSVARTLDVYGSVNGNALNCNSFRVYGSCVGKNITISGKMEVAGSLNVSDSTFQDIEIKIVEESVLDNSSAANITIEPDNGRPQRLRLKGKTVIAGDITFKSGSGEIRQDSTAEVKGKISGAQVMR